jgi:hypothetical protein
MNDELERKWQESTVIYFNVLFLHLPGGTEENHSTDTCPTGRTCNYPMLRWLSSGLLRPDDGGSKHL